MLESKIDNLLTLMTDIQTNSFRQTPNSVFLISMHNSRSRTTRTRFTSTQREPINLSRTVLSNQEMQHLYQLFLGKCKDIHQVATDSNWKLFVKSFMKKNPSHSSQETIFSLNYSELSLGRSAPAVINAFLKQHPQIESINLSKNHVDPT